MAELPLQEILDAFNSHDVDRVMSFFADDCVMDMPRGPAPGGRRLVGKEEVRSGVQARFDGIPDIHYGDDGYWSCGNRAVSEWTIRGTQASRGADRGARLRHPGVHRRQDQPQELLLEDHRRYVTCRSSCQSPGVLATCHRPSNASGPSVAA